MTEYQILKLIHENGDSVPFSSFAAKSIKSFKPELISDQMRLEVLIEMGLIKGELKSGSKLELTGKGIFRLDSLAQERAGKIKHIFVEIFLAIISALAGALLSGPFWGLGG